MSALYPVQLCNYVGYSFEENTMKRLFLVLMLLSAATVASAADKNWNAQGDQTDWFDDANWLASGPPAASDNAKVDLTDASVEIGQTFGAQSLTIGGKKSSTVSVSNFTAGTLEPVNATDDAIFARRGGKLILKGSTGKITVKGAYKDSEEVIPEEPSFMLYAK